MEKVPRRSVTIGIGPNHLFYDVYFNKVIFALVSIGGLMTPNSVMIPPVISSAGVTSNAGFQHWMPVVKMNE